MGRVVMLSNGSMMVGINEYGLVHDFYFPYVGEDNLTNARSLQHLIGVWVDNKFSWLDDSSWQTNTDFESDALVSKIAVENSNFGLRLEFSDFVDSEHTAFCRRINIVNLSSNKRQVRIFFHQVFQISHSGRADTVLFVPQGNYLYDYKGRCALLISARTSDNKPFDQFSIGNYGIEGKEGTYKDAEDGNLDGNLVEHGSVDSVIRCSVSLEPSSSDFVDYWVVASNSQDEAEIIHNQLLAHGLHARLDETRAHWRSWLGIAGPKTEMIDEKYRSEFKKSLMIIKAHIDKHGGIIASGDSSIYNYGRDYYSYVWPRDGGLTMLTLMKLGYYEEAKRFFEFCIDTINPGGYMMHKYQPDRSIGSTWHPLMHRHHPELAIQEDETAVVVYALAEYARLKPDDKLIARAYSKFILPAANFMTSFIDYSTNLPHASYDLWEERFATHTYTVVITKAALNSAADLAEKLGHQESANHWRDGATKIGKALGQLYSDEIKSYRKSQLLDADGKLEYDNTIDSSTFYSFLEFDPDSITDKKFLQSVDTVKAKLLSSSPSGGVIRYEHDNYFLSHPEYLGNPWIICTLWLAQYFIKSGDRQEATKLIDWCLTTATPGGILAEQVDPVDSRQVGVSPLVWSHAELVNTLLLLYEQ